MLRFLTAAQALEIDVKLMSEHGAYATEQLMELAGLSCAQVIESVYNKDTYPKPLICCGLDSNCSLQSKKRQTHTHTHAHPYST